MVKYDINVDVKYKRIEKELLENYFEKDLNLSLDDFLFEIPIS
jgi:hypothetical protein